MEATQHFRRHKMHPTTLTHECLRKHALVLLESIHDTDLLLLLQK